MDENMVPMGKDNYQGPMRDTALTALDGMIQHHESALAGLRHLRKMLVQIENGSPVEHLLWDMLTVFRSRGRF
jgi:hypothetical protein